MKEINKFLAEGLECKELIKTKNAEIHLLDSSIKVRDAIERNYQGQVREYKRIEEKLTKQNSELVSDNEKKSAEINTQTKRKRIWRNVALSEAGVIVLTALIFLL